MFFIFPSQKILRCFQSQGRKSGIPGVEHSHTLRLGIGPFPLMFFCSALFKVLPKFKIDFFIVIV
ncbi:hypothetical protein CXF68_08150 [Tenacibaculum sp. Bg11-29]|nr:hypothetical protein CXF68_08150 [Tenacibaculum sp. Bg11-29]